MTTVLTAVVGVFLLMSVWVAVGQLARKRLGERQGDCHGGGGKCSCGRDAGRAEECRSSGAAEQRRLHQDDLLTDEFPPDSAGRG